jgi:5,10-methylenetetrahydromethanopterin reductase
VRDFDRHLEELRPLLRGEEARVGEDRVPIRHLMPDHGFVDFTHPIPLYISGFGPKSLAIAGKHGDGAVLALPGSAGVMEYIWEMLESGATAAGRTLDRGSFYTTALTTMVVLEPGERRDSARVKSQCGAMAMAAVHYAYDQHRNFGHQPPRWAEGIWSDYTALLERTPAARRHQRIHAGHNCWVMPEEERFLVPEVLEAASMIGTPDELVDPLRALAGAGLNQVMILPNWDTRFDVLTEVGTQVLPHV